MHEATWHRFVGESATTLKVKVKDDEDGDDVEEALVNIRIAAVETSKRCWSIDIS